MSAECPQKRSRAVVGGALSAVGARRRRAPASALPSLRRRGRGWSVVNRRARRAPACKAASGLSNRRATPISPVSSGTVIKPMVGVTVLSRDIGHSVAMGDVDQVERRRADEIPQTGIGPDIAVPMGQQAVQMQLALPQGAAPHPCGRGRS
jgi:hypothetical protein